MFLVILAKNQFLPMINLDSILTCVSDKSRKSFKYYLGEYFVHKCIIGMVKKSKYFSRAMKKYFYIKNL